MHDGVGGIKILKMSTNLREQSKWLSRPFNLNLEKFHDIIIIEKINAIDFVFLTNSKIF